ncbi:MAG: hypothetical protein KatS3mg131_2299 [Candidatus Tectimicrobiota bacterium]|nr:MAG: hypothetical protein KatS3mg131_2299 [Candidatus Tectomicrobia bacterium]
MMPRRTLAPALVLVAALAAVALLGCDGDEEAQRSATPADLSGREFVFADGRAFAAALAGQAVTLTFGDFAADGDGNPNTGPFSLVAAGDTAQGTVTVASCSFAIAASTFDPGTFPELQPEETLPRECRVDAEGRLQVRDPATDATSTSQPPSPAAAPPTTEVAFVLTSDFATGSYSVIDLATRRLFADIVLGGVHSDALARAHQGRIYVVNRLGQDNIQILDPAQGYTTVAQQSVEPGSNPQDIAFAAGKAYVSRLKSAELLILDPDTLEARGTIDLSGFTKPEDLDGVPELYRMLVHEGLLYVLLQHLDFTTGFPVRRVAPGEVVVIDPASDSVVDVIPLNGTNPFSFLQFSPEVRGGRLLVSSVGDFGVLDGGIEAIDPATGSVEFVVTEAALGGDITHFQVISADKGFAVVTDASFLNALVAFNPTTGERLATLEGPRDDFMPHFAVNRRGELYLAVADLETPTPEVLVFDTASDAEIARVRSGALPPVFVLFLE